MKPICVPCQRFYRVKKNGYYFIEGMPTHEGAKPGTEDTDWWKPYKLWVGDLWECEGCHAQIVNGVGMSPLAEHYQPDFAKHVRQCAYGQDGTTELLQVNDC